MSAIEDAVKILNKQWYVAVTKGVGLDPSQFQLAQGSISFGTTSDSVWNMFDNMPPEAVNNYFNPAQINSFRNTYGAVINNLIPQTGDAIQAALGDKYTAWLEYKSKNPPPDDIDWSDPAAIQKATIASFRKFSYMNSVNSDTEKKVVTLLGQNDVVSVAMDKWNASADKGRAFTASIAKLKAAVTAGQEKSAGMDSKTQSSDVSQAWASASVSVGWGFFRGSASASWSKFASEVTTQGLNFKATFKKQATVLGGPYLAKTSTDPDLTGFVPWFDTAALKTAKANNNNLVWKPGAPTWEQTFGPTGNMQRWVAGLVVVDGIETTMTTAATVKKEDQQGVRTAFSAGYWPFFSASGQGGWQHNTSFDDAGRVTVTSSSKQGNPNLLGVLVSPISKLIG